MYTQNFHVTSTKRVKNGKIKKLKVRYGDEFTNDKANNRDLDKELETLKG